MLGRFLEVSVHAPDILESLAFYERLGFTQAPVGETWSHPYAVVTDGRLFIGLHLPDSIQHLFRGNCRTEKNSLPARLFS